ncbi:MAG: hypothetical protein IJH37_07760 [Clostridia bacterium]|nr:hypothetical protein [Clostridia bacterium]
MSKKNKCRKSLNGSKNKQNIKIDNKVFFVVVLLFMSYFQLTALGVELSDTDKTFQCIPTPVRKYSKTNTLRFNRFTKCISQYMRQANFTSMGASITDGAFAMTVLTAASDSPYPLIIDPEIIKQNLPIARKYLEHVGLNVFKQQ